MLVGTGSGKQPGGSLGREGRLSFASNLLRAPGMPWPLRASFLYPDSEESRGARCKSSSCAVRAPPAPSAQSMRGLLHLQLSHLRSPETGRRQERQPPRPGQFSQTRGSQRGAPRWLPFPPLSPSHTAPLATTPPGEFLPAGVRPRRKVPGAPPAVGGPSASTLPPSPNSLLSPLHLAGEETGLGHPVTP